MSDDTLVACFVTLLGIVVFGSCQAGKGTRDFEVKATCAELCGPIEGHFSPSKGCVCKNPITKQWSYPK